VLKFTALLILSAYEVEHENPRFGDFQVNGELV